MRTLFFLLVFLNFSTNVFTQVVNIENKRIYDDTAGWSGTLDGSFSAQQTKDFLFNLNFRTLAQYKTKKHFLLLINDFGYSAGGVIYANRGMSHLRYAYRIANSAWKWETYVQTQYNQLLLQRSRTLVGSGLRWKFRDKNDAKFFVGSSFFYEYEEIRPYTEFNSTIRWSNYISWYINRPNYTFTAATYFQKSFDIQNDWRISGQYTFLYKLGKKIDLKMEFSNYYDSKPPQTVRKWVFNSSIGFVLRLG
jgi:hypothetical protein